QVTRRLVVHVDARRRAEADARRGPAEVTGELGHRAHRVRRHHPRPEPERRQPDGDERRAVGEGEVDSVTWSDAVTGEQSGAATDGVVELAVGPFGDVA